MDPMAFKDAWTDGFFQVCKRHGIDAPSAFLKLAQLADEEQAQESEPAPEKKPRARRKRKEDGQDAPAAAEGGRKESLRDKILSGLVSYGIPAVALAGLGYGAYKAAPAIGRAWDEASAKARDEASKAESQRQHVAVRGQRLPYEQAMAMGNPAKHVGEPLSINVPAEALAMANPDTQKAVADHAKFIRDNPGTFWSYGWTSTKRQTEQALRRLAEQRLQEDKIPILNQSAGRL